MIIYLAEAIDQHEPDSDHAASAMVESGRLLTLLAEWGHAVYSPRRAWYMTSVNGEAIGVDALNRSAMDSADVLVALLPSHVGSIGVPTEIEYFTNTTSKHAIVIGDTRSVVLEANPRVHRMPWDWTSQDLMGALERLGRNTAATDLTFAKGGVVSPSFPFNDNGGLIPDGLAHAKRLSQRTKEGLLRVAYGGPFSVEGEDQLVNRRPLPFTRTHEQAQDLRRGYKHDAGLDLTTTTEVRMRRGEWTDIPCGVAVQLPDDVFGWVVARSSTFKRWGIQVMPGIIDPGYRGELKVSAFYPYLAGEDDPWNEDAGDPPASGVTVPAGTRLAQLLILPNLVPTFRPRRTEDGALEASDRGTNGWGSSGT